MNKSMLALLLGLGLATAAPVAAQDLTAREIMQKAENRDDGDNSVSDMEMILIDRNGHQRQRVIRSYSKDQGSDELKIMFFVEPADVRDTGFLTYDYDAADRDDDQWLYLPALKKSKRIASSDKSGSFMGSDFSYADMTRRNLDAYDFRILKEQKVNGHDAWLVESVPRNDAEIERTGYSKSVLFIRKDNFVPVRAVHWQTDGRLKYMEAQKVEQIDGVWMVTENRMTTREGKSVVHQTILRFHNVRFNQPLEEEMFTLRQLEKGL